MSYCSLFSLARSQFILTCCAFHTHDWTLHIDVTLVAKHIWICLDKKYLKQIKKKVVYHFQNNIKSILTTYWKILGHIQSLQDKLKKLSKIKIVTRTYLTDLKIFTLNFKQHFAKRLDKDIWSLIQLSTQSNSPFCQYKKECHFQTVHQLVVTPHLLEDL